MFFALMLIMTDPTSINVGVTICDACTRFLSTLIASKIRHLSPMIKKNVEIPSELNGRTHRSPGTGSNTLHLADSFPLSSQHEVDSRDAGTEQPAQVQSRLITGPEPQRESTVRVDDQTIRVAVSRSPQIARLHILHRSGPPTRVHVLSRESSNPDGTLLNRMLLYTSTSPSASIDIVKPEEGSRTSLR
jgi:hypothetical protein